MTDIESQHQRAKSVVQQWADKRGHDRCWYYPELFADLAKIFRIECSDPCLPSREEFELGCKRYQNDVFDNSKL
jgi:hypothetical protein